MRRSTERVVGAAAAIILLVDIVAVAFVGGPSATSAGITGRVIAAATRTMAARTARFKLEYHGTITLSGHQQPIGQSEDGVVDFANHAQQFTMTTSGLLTNARFVDGVTYIAFPAAIRSAVHIPTPWVAIKVPAGLVGAPAAGDPASTLRAMTTTSNGTVAAGRDAGRETIGGVSTSRYALTLVAAAASRQAQDLGRSILPGLAPTIKVTSIVSDVWIDDQGLIRQMSVTTAANLTFPSGGSAVEHLTTTSTYSDFGVTANVKAPAPDQVTTIANLPQLLNNLTGGATPSA